MTMPALYPQESHDVDVFVQLQVGGVRPIASFEKRLGSIALTT